MASNRNAKRKIINNMPNTKAIASFCLAYFSMRR